MGENAKHKRHAPKVGEFIWLVPIRYWEPDDYEPELFFIQRVLSDDRGWYGYHEGYGHEAYISYDPNGWAWTKDDAEDLMKALIILKDVIHSTDTGHIVRELLEERWQNNV